jgi:hypothetical protein
MTLTGREVPQTKENLPKDEAQLNSAIPRAVLPLHVDTTYAAGQSAEWQSGEAQPSQWLPSSVSAAIVRQPMTLLTPMADAALDYADAIDRVVLEAHAQAKRDNARTIVLYGPKNRAELDPVFDGLVERGYLRPAASGYVLTPAGERRTQKVRPSRADLLPVG